MSETDEYVQRFKELNSENLKTLCDALEKKVPWQKDIVQKYSSTNKQTIFTNGYQRAIERGRIGNSNGKKVSLYDAIVILSCESFSSRSRACSPPIKQKSDGCEEETGPCVSLDLNISFEDDSNAENQSIDDIGLLESVDGLIIFKIQEL
ncbi:Protein SMAX1-LIKE 3 [Camellia lanceoleosa]|uniref:Protein SMAX1-LIKE 3 n=1 Tax=Camellia lanceoleosa TaxID=1840588 RepID=A0ACC0FPF5_9ERIC|nr:Protein SMAX1-LIKE 3 [Camellia lanceoleosa]